MIDYSNLCYGCFTDTKGIFPCPHCGYDPYRTPANPQHLSPGTIINKNYLIGKTLGQGGFGITYLGLDLNGGRKCAIKEYFPIGLVNRQGLFVVPNDANAQILIKRGINLFFKEALILGNFSSHPNIVNILHFFRENSTAYIVMEYIEGRSLKEYLLSRGGSISFEESRQILYPIMLALTDLHKTGLLHRDIAPDNIYLTSNGQAKLLDFGAARFGQIEETQNAASIIKPGYAPLEQYSGRTGQGTWTDVYAMGATFYRALTGIVPMPATDRAAGHLMLSPKDTGAVLPDIANFAIMRAMEIQPERRFQSMEEFAEYIRKAGEEKQNTLIQPGANIVERHDSVTQLNRTSQAPIWQQNSPAQSSSMPSVKPAIFKLSPIPLNAGQELPGNASIRFQPQITDNQTTGIPMIQPSSYPPSLQSQITSAPNAANKTGFKKKNLKGKKFRLGLFCMLAILLCVWLILRFRNKANPQSASSQQQIFPISTQAITESIPK